MDLEIIEDCEFIFKIKDNESNFFYNRGIWVEQEEEAQIFDIYEKALVMCCIIQNKEKELKEGWDF